jgi:hypothetical protein
MPAYEDTTYKHDPYDLTRMGPVDSTDVYASRVNHLLRLPQYAWSAMVFPLGQFAIYAEHSKLWVRYFELFTNSDGTFGVFPLVQFGGETGNGVGTRFFHSNVFGKRKILTGQYVYSGNKGQFGDGLYVHPNVMGSWLTWKMEGGYLKTRNHEANINGALDDRTEDRLFEIGQIDLQTSMAWQLRRGPMARFMPQVGMTAWVGYGKRDFQPVVGGIQLLTDAGSTHQARLTKGLGSQYDFYRLGGQLVLDNRDYKSPVQSLSHPPQLSVSGTDCATIWGAVLFLPGHWLSRTRRPGLI